jgi:single-strand DNA-binding protein
MNCVNLIGRLTKDPDIKYTQTNNTAIANFTLAVNRRFTKEGQPTADFINIVAWGKTGEFCSKYFQKGMQVAIQGRIQTRNWQDDQGQKHYATEVIAEQCFFADSKRESQNDLQFENSAPATNNFDDEPLPF